MQQIVFDFEFADKEQLMSITDCRRVLEKAFLSPPSVNTIKAWIEDNRLKGLRLDGRYFVKKGSLHDLCVRLKNTNYGDEVLPSGLPEKAE